MLYAIASIIIGLVLLVWSADRFVDGAASTARHFGMPPLLIGMVIVGFGTSVPEMLVSALSAMQGNPGLALGNAYGSNIANIALILGAAALISPIIVHSQVLRRELPLLLGISAVSILLLWDGSLSRLDSAILLIMFACIMGWSIMQGMRARTDAFSKEMDVEMASSIMPLKKSVMWLVVGLVLLILSSRMLVWGAVTIAQSLGVSDLIIGLTIVALGTSLPELASSVAAALKKEHDIALGNVLGSNLFNTLAVVGIAGSIHPLEVENAVLFRDMPIMLGLTLSLVFMGLCGRKNARINRFEACLLLLSYVGYNGWLVFTTLA
ncbi:calcium/sodium antiporter [Desulfovibrio subterraneus]|uniref:Sodium:calcium antiporter n=1 Tax=Desulfovibrio subterraneus TaxID=2718620 RepID=A0A7J0BJT6_9BACT|nr:calcium/sodium antiporter [Desulfovibrio subterraneus]GFM33838.1 sodium:calcium antiporter [Desulfovibrio subterraneus]